MATVKPVSNFDAQYDAQKLRTAMKGLGTDEDTLIRIITKRSNKQRQEIKSAFKQSFGRDLMDDVKSEVSGDFEKVLVGLLYTPADYDAVCVHKAISGLGTDDDALIEILCSRTNAELAELKDAYKKLYKKDIEKDIKGDTSGDYKYLLVQIQNGSRANEDEELEEKKIAADVKMIHTAMEGLGTDEEQLRIVFGTRSFAHLNAMFDLFKKTHKKDITQAIKSELSLNFKQAMLTIIQCARNRPEFFAERLVKAMKGAGTDDTALIRLIVSRCEKDMVEIKQAFHRISPNKRTLEEWIKDDIGSTFSKDYLNSLLSLL